MTQGGWRWEGRCWKRELPSLRLRASWLAPHFSCDMRPAHPHLSPAVAQLMSLEELRVIYRTQVSVNTRKAGDAGPLCGTG